MKNKEIETRQVLAKELIENSLNSLDQNQYIDGIAGMNLVTILQMLIEWSIEANKTKKDIHTIIDERNPYPLVLNSILHNTVKDYYL